jgi:hypothetical protein
MIVSFAFLMISVSQTPKSHLKKARTSAYAMFEVIDRIPPIDSFARL